MLAQFLSTSRFGSRLLVFTAMLSAAASLVAFPPAPYYTIYGDVRDEFGYLIPAGTASVVFYYGGHEVARHPLMGATGADFNYQIRMRLDANRSGTQVYTSSVVNSGAAYTLAVDIAGVLFYPLEITTPPTVGVAADRRRLDLTLGEDLDHDGLPDAWERMQLYYAGLDSNDLSLMTPSGDLDGDGQSNLQEYIAGTFASDAQETFSLKMKAVTATQADFEFFTITSKVYRLEQSADLKAWSSVAFKTGTSAAAATAAYTATGVGLVDGFVPVTVSNQQMFYRLIVR